MASSSSKIAIPRTAHLLHTTRARKRVTRACDTCRERKTKCNGEKPTCRQCGDLNLECEYSAVKRVREKLQLENATSRTRRYEELLRDLAPNVDKRSRRRIKSALKGSPGDNHQNETTPDIDTSPLSTSASSSTSMGSLADIDVVGEDLNRSERSRATGYIGKNSEISWLHGLAEVSMEKDRREAEGTGDSTDVSRDLEDNAISSISYYLDDCHLSESEDAGSPFDLPSRELADRLLRVYLDTVDPSFPIIRKRLFMLQVDNLYSQPSSGPGRQWLAILNLIFAIGSKFRQHTQGVSSASQFDARSEVFFWRAKALSVGENVLFDHADLQQVQVESLVAFYFLASAQINRAWRMVGIATRSAIALGLNLRGTPSSIHPVSMEVRTRTWSSILYLEHLLTSMTSRTSCLSESASTVYPPLPFEEESFKMPHVRRLLEDLQYRESHLYWTLHQNEEQNQAKQQALRGIEESSALYFFHLVDLAMITHSIANRVYSADVLRDGWAQVERRMRFYSTKMDDWLSSLLPPLQFTDEEGNVMHSMSHLHQISLALSYFSARIVLTRPCLARSKTNAGTPKGIQKSRFDTGSAQSCLRSALALVSILPDEPDTDWVFTMSPWWCILHFLMQAVSVLLIHLSITSNSILDSDENKSAEEVDYHATESQATILAATRKTIQWLSTLSERDESFSRAFRICSRLFRRIAPSPEDERTGKGKRPESLQSTPQSGSPLNNATDDKQPNAQTDRHKRQRRVKQGEDDDELLVDFRNRSEKLDVFTTGLVQSLDQANLFANPEVDMTDNPPISGDPYKTLFPYMNDVSMDWSSIFDMADLSH